MEAYGDGEDDRDADNGGGGNDKDSVGTIILMITMMKKSMVIMTMMATVVMMMMMGTIFLVMMVMTSTMAMTTVAINAATAASAMTVMTMASSFCVCTPLTGKDLGRLLQADSGEELHMRCRTLLHGSLLGPSFFTHPVFRFRPADVHQPCGGGC